MPYEHLADLLDRNSILSLARTSRRAHAEYLADPVLAGWASNPLLQREHLELVALRLARRDLYRLARTCRRARFLLVREPHSGNERLRWVRLAQTHFERVCRLQDQVSMAAERTASARALYERGAATRARLFGITEHTIQIAAISGGGAGAVSLYDLISGNSSIYWSRLSICIGVVSVLIAVVFTWLLRPHDQRQAEAERASGAEAIMRQRLDSALHLVGHARERLEEAEERLWRNEGRPQMAAPVPMPEPPSEASTAVVTANADQPPPEPADEDVIDLVTPGVLALRAARRAEAEAVSVHLSPEAPPQATDPDSLD